MTEEVSRFTNKDFLAILGSLTILISFLVSVGWVLEYGIAPAIDYLRGAINLTEYQQGVLDTIEVIIFIMVVGYVVDSVFKNPPMSRM